MIVTMFERIHRACRYTKHTLQRAMKRMGFPYSKLRLIPCQPASLEEQQKFKKDANEEITRLYKLGYAIIAADEAGNIEGFCCRIWMASKRRFQYNPDQV